MPRAGPPGGPVGGPSQRRRVALGVSVLLLVDVIWVASSELTSYVFSQYNKPFFSTFAKTSMFVIYLLGFVVWRPWRRQCARRFHAGPLAWFTDAEGYFATCNGESATDGSLSEPLYVPVRFHDLPGGKPDAAQSDAETTAKKSRVRFSHVMEVRQLPWSAGAEGAPQPADPPDSPGLEPKTPDKLPPSQWFLANFSYQEALSDAQVALVNILSSTSGLFTLFLAAMFPSNAGDRFTLSKLLAVLLSIGGVVLVSLAGPDPSPQKDALGSAWALAGAALYAVYVVMIKRKVEREDRLDIAMFFGFVGLFNLVLLWPGFLLLHYTGWEAFELPSKSVWLYIFLNGLIGTVLSEFLWLWGCFLTSSLMGTLALSLTIPLSITADMCVHKVQFSWLFLAGAVSVFLSFVTVTLLCHYNNWDPVTVGIRRVFAFICRKHRIPRFSEDGEQRQSLIPLHHTQPEDETTSSS
ncbi:solute carrier family 35 member F5 isoform X2 [Tachyglossus aculeatus]|uniref:solute carrier family 35 member F5 isoform X2 n=1 Tax=Tachyglossus aculeatus TaxID=9261 RepID=UPI0018F28279|nr:solute carrier family 35 member F5 isoform X2 [Tachyglossus aculeatus]